MNIADGGNAPPKMYGDNSPTKRPEIRAKIGAANKISLKGRKVAEECIYNRKLFKTWFRRTAKRFSNNRRCER